ncbi:MAG: crossover junction endodeoxyribonuclease RuvC [Flavitalea sp.]
MQKPAKIILGIDPGSLVMGYCIITAEGSRLSLIDMDVLKISAKKDNYERLELIYSKVHELIIRFKPDSFAIEAPFFGKNVQSMLKLGRAQGVAIAAAIGAGLKVTEYSPRKIKQSVTGNGNADKEQVWKMLQQILLLKDMAVLKCFDASDACAVAVCHHFQDNGIPATASPKQAGWKAFISAHPQRIKSK